MTKIRRISDDDSEAVPEASKECGLPTDKTVCHAYYTTYHYSFFLLGSAVFMLYVLWVHRLKE